MDLLLRIGVQLLVAFVIFRKKYSRYIQSSTYKFTYSIATIRGR